VREGRVARCVAATDARRSPARPTPEQQAEVAAPSRVHSHDLSVDHRVCALTACASSSHRCGQCLKVCPFRDTRSQWCPSMWASARKPSCFTSKSQSGWSNGSGSRSSGLGRSVFGRTRNGGVLGQAPDDRTRTLWRAPTQPGTECREPLSPGFLAALVFACCRRSVVSGAPDICNDPALPGRPEARSSLARES
jgi:hypothetical protein